MNHNELRRRYLEFFKKRGHIIVPSDSLVPANDPTLLFTSAGMNQFKEEFLGNVRDFTRAASCQKCLRTPDIEQVGKTYYHHTFFEMLGNFSFGDYFKEEAIEWAWEFMIRELKIPEEKLWVSVYIDDDDAYNIWKDKIGITENRIVKLGQKSNFWPQEAKDKGPNGPCGPCSEIFYDYGEAEGCAKKDCSPACDCNRFVEVWNLVFTQYERKDSGILDPLPNRNIDTGMGLERLCAVMQGVRSNFQTDLFAPIVQAIESEIGLKRHTNIYAIADHIRSASFAISDGVYPSNENRGYVIRSIIRKAVLHGRNLGADRPFLYKLVHSIGTVMKDVYPEILKSREDISSVILAEENKFLSTLDDGMRKAKVKVEEIKAKGEDTLNGSVAGELYGTYGFPEIMISEIAEENNLKFDKKGFDEFLEKERERSRSKSQIHDAIFVSSGITEKTEFIGYEKLEEDSKITAILKDDERLDSAAAPAAIYVILDKSPFYGESGGQVGDTGTLVSKEAEADVVDAKQKSEAILLSVTLKRGVLKKGDLVKAKVDKQRRLSIARNHTATHLLQYALRKILGEHVKQQGSLVAPDKLRFDFTHFKALTDDELKRVEEFVNSAIQNVSKVKTEEKVFEDAKREGALAFFEEKYKQKVRVVSIGDYSKEFCGGTHLDNISAIGLFKIVSESSIASGIRRIEAVTADDAYKRVKELEDLLIDIAKMLRCDVSQVQSRCVKLISEFDSAEKKISALIAKQVGSSVDSIVDSAKNINGTKLIIRDFGQTDVNILRNAADSIRSKMLSFILFLTASKDGKINFLLSLSDDLVSAGHRAGALVSQIAEKIGGSGGGRPSMALGGAKDVGKLNELLKEAESIIVKEIKK